MPKVVRELIHAGWHVEAEGKAFRRPGDHQGRCAQRHRLVRTPRRGGLRRRRRPPCRSCWPPCGAATPWCALGDGTYGLLPEEWLERFAPLAGLGTKEEDHLRFRRNQAGLLDALLAAQPEVRVDEMFAARARTHAHLHRREDGARSRRASSANCAITSAKAWAGWSSCASSASAAAWRTIWASARRRRCWRVLEARRTEGTRAIAGGGAEIADVQLARGGGALHAATARAGTHRPGARHGADRRARPGADHLRHAAARRRATGGDRVRLRGAG